MEGAAVLDGKRSRKPWSSGVPRLGFDSSALRHFNPWRGGRAGKVPVCYTEAAGEPAREFRISPSPPQFRRAASRAARRARLRFYRPKAARLRRPALAGGGAGSLPPWTVQPRRSGGFQEEIEMSEDSTTTPPTEPTEGDTDAGNGETADTSRE
jgi:hypothetical protein